MDEPNHSDQLATAGPSQSVLDLRRSSVEVSAKYQEHAENVSAKLVIAIHDLDFARARILVRELDSVVALLDRVRYFAAAVEDQPMPDLLKDVHKATGYPLAPWRNTIPEFDDEVVHAEFLEALRERRMRNCVVDEDAEG